MSTLIELAVFALLLCMQITGDLNDEYLIMSMISHHEQSELWALMSIFAIQYELLSHVR